MWETVASVEPIMSSSLFDSHSLYALRYKEFSIFRMRNFAVLIRRINQPSQVLGTQVTVLRRYKRLTNLKKTLAVFHLEPSNYMYIWYQVQIATNCWQIRWQRLSGTDLLDGAPTSMREHNSNYILWQHYTSNFNSELFSVKSKH